MPGQTLHQLDLALCRYVLDNIRGHRDHPGFASFAREQMEPAVWDYLQALNGDEEPQELLLNDAELYDLATIFADGPTDYHPAWVPYPPLHQRSVDCVREIRMELAADCADEWARLSKHFGRQLEQERISLYAGIQVVEKWVSEARRLVRAMGAVNLLPAPEGAFPTPTCPQPTVSSLPAAASTQPNANKDDSLRAMIAETHALQREVRDLLVSQRTVKDHYTVEEFARLVGKSDFTCREWCRLGRIRATKKNSGRGKYQAWTVSHEELLRYQKDGLLPLGR